MKRKIIILGACLAIAVCGIGAYASGFADTVISKLAAGKYTDENVIAFEAENTERKNKIAEALNNTGNNTAQTAETDSGESVGLDKYSLMLTAMNATITDPMEYNDLLVNYHYLKEVYRLTQDQMDYISDLVIDGCNMKDVIGLAYFWVDTNEDITLVKSMYDLKGEYAGKKNWYGNAYDRVTGAKNGSLSTEEVEAYMAKGLTADEILAADELSRKGVYTINQILDKMCEGQSLVEVANEIEDGGLIGVSAYSLNGTEAEPNYDAIENPYVITDSREASLLTGQTQGEVIASAAVGEDVEAALDENRSQKFSEIKASLDAAGLTKDETEVE